MKRVDSYGFEKLEAEYILKRAALANERMRYLILRLPDVIGPFDDSGRFWAYLLWLPLHRDAPLQLDNGDQTKPLSFVFSEDVVDVIMGVLAQVTRGEPPESSSFKIEVHGPPGEERKEKVGSVGGGFGENAIFNLAFEETPSLKEFLELVGECAGAGRPLEIARVVEPDTFYPSVNCGPVAIDRAKKSLGFEPTSLKEAVRKTVAFFEKVDKAHCEKEYHNVLKKLPAEVKAVLQGTKKP